MTPVESQSWFMKCIGVIAGLLVVLVVARIFNIDNSMVEVVILVIVALICIVACFLHKKAHKEVKDE